MYKFEITLSSGNRGETEVFDVDADRHDITHASPESGTPPFIVFYRDPAPAEPDDAANEPAQAVCGEVFRAPLHVLLAVKMLDDDGDE